MTAQDGLSTHVRGPELRRLRKAAFSSADAFAEACGSVSTPTVYRAERGGPVLRSYLARMAGELGVGIERLIADQADPDARTAVSLTGDWRGLMLATDRFGRPYVIEEETRLDQTGDRVEGRASQRDGDEAVDDIFRNCRFGGNVLTGQVQSSVWPFPLESGAFVLHGGREVAWLDGYICWYDLDSERPQFSKYVLIRRGSPSFDTDMANALRLLADEARLLRARRFLESGYDFETAVAMLSNAERAEAQGGGGERGAASSTSGPRIEAAAPEGAPLVALFPLSVLDHDPTQGFIADGLIDDIATDLARAEGVGVLPRSALPGGDAGGALAAARALGASHAISGSLRRTDARLRLNAQLVETATGRIVWAERYDHAAAEIAEIHEDVADDVANALSGASPAAPALSRPEARDPRAYELFLKGRSFYLRGMYTHSLRAAEAMLDRALAIDPRLARGWAQISICRTYLAQSLAQGSGGAAPDGEADARKALDLDPDLALAHAALGLARYAAGDHAAAERSLRDAVARDASLFEAQFFLARNLRLQGDRAGAAERFALAAKLRPTDFRASGLLAEELQALGRQDEAASRFRATIALVEAELEAHPDNAGALAFGAAVLADLGETERAEVWVGWALAIAPDDCLVHYNVARMHAIGGAPARARDHLRQAFDVPPVVRRRLAMWMRHDEDFAELAADPTFMDLLAADGAAPVSGRSP